MSSISGESYVKFLATLRSVADECDAPVGGGKCLGLYENPETQKELIKSLPDCDVKSVVQKTNQFVPDSLVRYEAACRTKDAGLLADVLLKKWVELAERALKEENSMTNVAAKLQEVADSFIWPKFQNASEFANKVCKLSSNSLVQELACMKGGDKEIPKRALSLLSIAKLEPVDDYLVNKYGPRMSKLTFDDVMRKSLTDEIVAMELQRCPNVVMADFSDAENLTEKAFAAGHKKLVEINLNNTSVNTAIFKRTELFPELKTIHQAKPKVVFDLTLYCKMEWKELRMKLEEATSLKINTRAFEILYTRFEECTSVDAFFCLCKIQDLLIESLNAGRLKDDFGFFGKLPWALWSAWKRWAADNSNQREYGELLTTILVNSVGGLRDERIKQNIEESFIYCLSHSHTNQIMEIPEEFSEANMIKARVLLKAFEDRHHPVLNQAANRVKNAIQFLYSRDTEYRQLWFLQEVYVVLSHLVDVSNYFYEHVLAQKNTELNDFIVACGFIMKSEKEKYFVSIRNEYDEIRKGARAQHLPLSKLILGTLESQDLPKFVQEGLLMPYFLNYKGMFEEKLTEELKFKLFTTLMNGELGGFNKQLVQAFEGLGKREGELGIWRNRALHVLAHYAGYKWIGPATDLVFKDDMGLMKDVREFACIALMQLKIPDHLIVKQETAMAIPSSAIPVPKNSESID